MPSDLLSRIGLRAFPMTEERAVHSDAEPTEVERSPPAVLGQVNGGSFLILVAYRAAGSVGSPSTWAVHLRGRLPEGRVEFNALRATGGGWPGGGAMTIHFDNSERSFARPGRTGASGSRVEAFHRRHFGRGRWILRS